MIIVLFPNNLSLIHNRFLAPERQKTKSVRNLNEEIPGGCLSLVSRAMSELQFTFTAVCYLKMEEFNENII